MRVSLISKWSQRESVPYIVLIVAVFLAYANAWSNGFLLDDMVLIIQNDLLKHWSSLPELLTSLSQHGSRLTGGFYRPVQEFLFFLIYQAFGSSPVAFHCVNVLLQALATCLVFRLGRCLHWGIFTSFAAALVWSVHPLNTEVVDYASSSADILCACFCLAGIMVLLPDFAPRQFWKAGLFFILALGSKEAAIVFPALAAFTLFLVAGERLTPSLYIRTWPLWLILAIYFASWAYLMRNEAPLLMHDPADAEYSLIYTHDTINRMLTSLATLPVYLGLVIWPVDLHMERSYPIFSSLLSWQVLCGMALVAAALLQIIWGRGKRGLACSWGLLWFAAAFSPYTGIFKPMNAFVSEHWLYLPGIGLSLGLSQTIALWIKKQKSEEARKVVAGLVVLAAAAFGSVTFVQNRVWHDDVSFYEHIFACGEISGRAHSGFGHYYFNHGDYDNAKEQFLASVAHPPPVWLSEMAGIHMHLAFIYLGARPNEHGLIAAHEVAIVLPLTPYLPEATAELEKVLEIDQNAYWAHKFLAMIYTHTGERDKALFHEKRAEDILQSGQNPDRIL